MTIAYDKLLALHIPEVVQSYTQKDCILYALGLGLGQDPLDADELPFVYEKDIKVLPTMAVVLGYPGFWIKDLDTGIDWLNMLAGEHALTLHRPMPPSGTIVGRTRVVDVIDKGSGRGALVYSERSVVERESGVPLATMRQTAFCRNDGGFGGPTRIQPPAHPIPQRPPDLVHDRCTRAEMALIYRLSGDPNPLHVDPEVARGAGFPRPILHGLATFGVAGYAILKEYCGSDPARLAGIAGRFSAPVFPGETVRIETWRDGDVVSFRARVVERDVVAINNGRADIALQ
jgi:acyl dehydratase